MASVDIIHMYIDTNIRMIMNDKKHLIYIDIGVIYPVTAVWEF